MKKRSIIFALICNLLFAGSGFACPRIHNIVDYNCDGQLRIAIAGDSLVFGFGDKKNGNKGGYVLRLQRALPQAEIVNLGIQGLHTGPYLTTLAREFKDPNSELYAEFFSADIVILDLGRNDRWEFGLPSATNRNLKRIASLIKSEAASQGFVPPYVITAVLMLPNRGSQGPWVAELNQLIRRGHSGSAPADLRFDLVSKRLLDSDQIHPTSAGYDALYKTALSYLKKKVAPRLEKLRPDADQDGVSDFFETSKFGTDPALADTDADGVIDGTELFVNKTDPLVP
jgi:lysophospholipase L1-like esterase